jgi:hypothetical protein
MIALELIENISRHSPILFGKFCNIFGKDFEQLTPSTRKIAEQAKAWRNVLNQTYTITPLPSIRKKITPASYYRGFHNFNELYADKKDPNILWGVDDDSYHPTSIDISTQTVTQERLFTPLRTVNVEEEDKKRRVYEKNNAIHGHTRARSITAGDDSYEYLYTQDPFFIDKEDRTSIFLNHKKIPLNCGPIQSVAKMGPFLVVSAQGHLHFFQKAKDVEKGLTLVSTLYNFRFCTDVVVSSDETKLFVVDGGSRVHCLDFKAKEARTHRYDKLLSYALVRQARDISLIALNSILNIPSRQFLAIQGLLLLKSVYWVANNPVSTLLIVSTFQVATTFIAINVLTLAIHIAYKGYQAARKEVLQN